MGFAPILSAAVFSTPVSELPTPLLHYGSSHACCVRSPLQVAAPARQKLVSLKPPHPSILNTNLAMQLRSCSMSLLKPLRVKSGEMEGNPSNDGFTIDEETLQKDLEKAIKDENYALAAKLRDDIQRLHNDSKASIIAANTQFYNAFSNGDFVAMRAIWAKGDNVCCVHPGAGAISGYDMVMSSWEIICGANHEFPITIDLRDAEVHVRGDLGYLSCLELVKTKGGSWGRQVATNIFERVDGHWFMSVHHASHVDM